jgi:hypothetical protein
LSPLGNNADYEDASTSVFEEIHAYGFEHGGWTSKTSVKHLRDDLHGKLTGDQVQEIIHHVNGELADQLRLQQVKLKKTGQVVYRSKITGRFSTLRTSEQELIYERFGRLTHFSAAELEEVERIKAKARRHENSDKIAEDVWRVKK